MKVKERADGAIPDKKTNTAAQNRSKMNPLMTALIGRTDFVLVWVRKFSQLGALLLAPQQNLNCCDDALGNTQTGLSGSTCLISVFKESIVALPCWG